MRIYRHLRRLQSVFGSGRSLVLGNLAAASTQSVAGTTLLPVCEYMCSPCISRTGGRKPKSKKVNILAPAASVSAALSLAHLPSSLTPLSISNSKLPKSENGAQDSPSAFQSETDELKAGDSLSALKRKSSEPGESGFGGSVSGAGGSKKKRKVDIVSIALRLEMTLVTEGHVATIPP